MRSRNIKPGLFQNDQLAECSIAARYLFTGLWCMADRKGRLEDRPKKIKMLLLPNDTVDVDGLLGELHHGGFITRYTVGNLSCIQITNFLKHQNPHPKEKASTLPEPPKEGESNPKRPSRVKVETSQEKVELSREKQPSSPADSLIPLSLIPDSLVTDSKTPAAQEQPRVARDTATTALGLAAREFVRWYDAEYKKQFGQSFAVSWPRDVKIAREILELITRDTKTLDAAKQEVVRRVHLYWQDDDKLAVKQAYSLTIFKIRHTSYTQAMLAAASGKNGDGPITARAFKD